MNVSGLISLTPIKINKRAKVETIIHCFDPSYDPFDLSANQKVEISSSRNSILNTHYTEKILSNHKAVKFTLQDLIDIGGDTKKVLRYMCPERFISQKELHEVNKSKRLRSISKSKISIFDSPVSTAKEILEKGLSQSRSSSIIMLENKLLVKKKGVSDKNNMLFKLSNRELSDYMKAKKVEISKQLQKFNNIKTENIAANSSVEYGKPVHPLEGCHDDEQYIPAIAHAQYDTSTQNSIKALYWGTPKPIRVEPSTDTHQLSRTQYNKYITRNRNSDTQKLTSIDNITEWESIQYKRGCFSKVLSKIEGSKNILHKQLKGHKHALSDMHSHSNNYVAECQKQLETVSNFNKIYKEKERDVEKHLKPYKSPKPSTKEILMLRRVETMKNSKNLKGI